MFDPLVAVFLGAYYHDFSIVLRLVCLSRDKQKERKIHWVCMVVCVLLLRIVANVFTRVLLVRGI